MSFDATTLSICPVEGRLVRYGGRTVTKKRPKGKDLTFGLCSKINDPSCRSKLCRFRIALLSVGEKMRGYCSLIHFFDVVVYVASQNFIGRHRSLLHSYKLSLLSSKALEIVCHSDCRKILLLFEDFLIYA